MFLLLHILTIKTLLPSYANRNEIALNVGKHRDSMS